MFGSMTSWMFFLNSIICFTLSIPIHMISLLPRREFLCHVSASQNYQSLCFWSSEPKIKIKHQLEAKREPRPEKAQGPTFSSRWCCDSCPAQAKSVFVFLYLYFCICIFVFVFLYLYFCICIFVFVFLHFCIFAFVFFVFILLYMYRTCAALVIRG